MIIRKTETKNSISANGLKNKYTWRHAIIFIMVAIVLSSLYLRFAWKKYQNNASKEAIMLAQSIESLLHPEDIVELTGSKEDMEKPEYNITKFSLKRLTDITNPIHFAYLMGERNGNIIFLLDSESPDSPDYSPPGQIYEEADDSSWEPFKKGSTVLTKPTTDRWGTWISVLVPVKNPSDGKVIAVLGIDYSASEWNLRLWRQMLPDIIIVLSLLMLFFALLRYLSQHFILKSLSEKLAFDEALYHSVFDQAPIGIAIVNDKTFVYQSDFGPSNINPMFEQILGRKNYELENIKWTEITHPDDLRADLEKFEQFKRGEINGYSMEKRFIKPDGSSVWTNMRISSFLANDNKHSMHLCLLEDISIRKETEQSFRESERSKSVLLSHLPGMAYRCKFDREWTMQFVSAGCLELTGYPPESFLNNKELSFNDIITPEYRDLLWEQWLQNLTKKLPFKYEYEIKTANGERKWILELGQGIYNEHGEAEALEGIILDISNRKEFENTLKYNSEHDIWTGLYNRKFLEQMLVNDENTGNFENRALVGINLSSVHLLSLAYGFQYSQELIKKIAKTLKLYCNQNHKLYNTYEYRFVFYIKDYKDKEEIVSFCDDVINTLMDILAVERIGGGIGVVEIDETNSLDTEKLLKNLLIASEKAISSYETSFGVCFFDEEMAAQIMREEMIGRELSQIATGERDDRLFMQFQPILDLETNQLCGFEALARLNSDQFGRISPLEFIPIAEKSKLIIPLGDIIIRKSLHFLKTLYDNGYHTVGVSINISAIQLLKNEFAQNMIDMMKAAKVSPSNVGLEITESVFASNYQELNIVLGHLKDIGVKIAIDDFGTGYSSLARERELNVNCLKIDKSFIDNLLVIDPEYAITGDIISMAHRLGHCVIAEGIEHNGQKEYLERCGCDKIQGYLIGRPLDEESALELLKKQPSINDCRLDAGNKPDKLQRSNPDSGTEKDQLQLILNSTAEAIYGIDLEGNCTFCNSSCIKLLGYQSQEDLLRENMHWKIHHTKHDGTPLPISKCKIFKSMQQGKGFEADDEVFWRADGTSFNVEYHSFPQIKNGNVIGAVVTFTDITDQKQKEAEIRYLSCHDTLTGLYNRRCFEENRYSIDTPDHLPLSVIFADINGLKMTNDIFGHAAGDELILKSAGILLQCCREQDVVARIGGDEFILLLPKTDKENANNILLKIKSELSSVRVAAIKCSIALGSDTKTSMEQPLEEIMANAENTMYKDKTMNRKTVNKEIIDTIIETLHSRSSKEKQHSIMVSELCGEVGKALDLPETEISKLKRAGYLHDIGKVILDEDSLKKENLSDEELEKKRQHSMVGYRILNLFDDTLDLAEYVYGHHEKWDGSGYPRGLKGEQIPMISRIISVVEAYERELTKRGLPIEERKKRAVEIIKNGRRTRFDPKIAEVVISMMAD